MCVEALEQLAWRNCGLPYSSKCSGLVWDSVLISLVPWKVSLLMAEGYNEVGFEVLSDPNYSMIL